MVGVSHAGAAVAAVAAKRLTDDRELSKSRRPRAWGTYLGASYRNLRALPGGKWLAREGSFRRKGGASQDAWATAEYVPGNPFLYAHRHGMEHKAPAKYGYGVTDGFRVTRPAAPLW